MHFGEKAARRAQNDASPEAIAFRHALRQAAPRIVLFLVAFYGLLGLAVWLGASWLWG